MTKELADARSQLSNTQDLFNELTNLRNNPAALDGIRELQTDPLIMRIKIEQNQVQIKLDELKNRYGNKHPRVIDTVSKIETLNDSLKASIERKIVAIGKEYKLLKQRVDNVEGKLAEGKLEIQKIGSKKFELDTLEREVATNRKLYDIFFSRYTEAGSAGGLEQANASIAEAAVPAPQPIRPRKTLVTGMAGLGALVFSILLAFLLEKLDRTVKGTREVENLLGLPLLGVLPLVKRSFGKRGKGNPLSPIGNADKAGMFAEAVNATRTSLCISDRAGVYNIILVTSSVPSEGKTTSSVNLAYSFGQQERVLLIDGDMRRPSVGKALGWTGNSPGLSDLIKGTAPPNQCIQRGVLDGSFDVLPAGRIPAHPLELLTTVRFEKILSELSRWYDRIIIDSAPVHAVSDALVFSKFADAVVYVVKSHSTPLNIIKQSLDRLQQVDAKMVGVLVTQADIKKLRSYGGDIHYGGFYDKYGYSDSSGDEAMPISRNFDLDEDLSKFLTGSDKFVDLGETRVRTIGEQFRSNRIKVTQRREAVTG